MTLIPGFKSALIFLVTSLLGLPLLAGDFQGGGGGLVNLRIKQYLNKRIYRLDGAGKKVAPGISVINSCLQNDQIHTIDPVFACRLTNSCKKKPRQKEHLNFPVRELKQEPTCKNGSLKIVDGRPQNKCKDYDPTKKKGFRKTHKLDVYQINIGEAGGGPTSPNFDHDLYMRQIKYTIPSCEELNLEM